ncbi:MAG: dihydroneopterin aldolase [Rhodothalassiaceae bacterium]
MTDARSTIAPIGYADAVRGTAHVFVNGYETKARIGVYRHEQKRFQPVRISVDVSVRERRALQDKLDNVLCYHKIVQGIETILSAGHINLVETLAERVAQLCLADHRAVSVRVRVEKLAAVAGAQSVGVEIERHASR